MELELHRVHNASTPEEEYAVLKVTADTNLNLFAVVDKTFNADGSMSNEHRHVYFFPAQAVKEGDWIVLRSSEGEDGEVGKFKDTGRAFRRYYCQSDVCIWNDEGDRASIIKYINGNSIEVPPVEK